jgi:hypothetical protein
LELNGEHANLSLTTNISLSPVCQLICTAFFVEKQAKPSKRGALRSVCIPDSSQPLVRLLAFQRAGKAESAVSIDLTPRVAVKEADCDAAVGH